MSEHTKKPLISAHAQAGTLYISYQQKTYAIPKKIADQYLIEGENKKTAKPKNTGVTLNSLFNNLEKKHTKAGVLLKGLRLREGLTQVDFAKKIKVTQANLSAMENGRRSIGKDIAKRIGKLFDTDYRYFL